jgi:hypothetical protein
MKHRIEKELQRIFTERNKEIEEENNFLLETAVNVFSKMIQEKTKEDFIEFHKKEKEQKKL